MKCDYCNAEILFITMSNDKKMPVESKKIEVWRLPKGKKIAMSESGEVFRCETEPTPYRSSEFAYVPHWANCPGAGSARKKR